MRNKNIKKLMNSKKDNIKKNMVLEEGEVIAQKINLKKIHELMMKNIAVETTMILEIKLIELKVEALDTIMKKPNLMMKIVG